MVKYFLLTAMICISLADVFEAIDIARSGMQVQQKKLEVIAENVANLNTAKTTNGDTFHQKEVVIKTDKKTNRPFVARIEDKPSSVQKIFDPANAEADEEGYVYIVDNSLSNEMVNMALTRRLYEANAAVFNSAKQTAQTIMNMGK